MHWCAFCCYLCYLCIESIFYTLYYGSSCVLNKIIYIYIYIYQSEVFKRLMTSVTGKLLWIVDTVHEMTTDLEISHPFETAVSSMKCFY